MNYLWQHPDWPNFKYNLEKLPNSALYQYSQSVARLTLSLETTPEDLRADAELGLLQGCFSGTVWCSQKITIRGVEGCEWVTGDVKAAIT